MPIPTIIRTEKKHNTIDTSASLILSACSYSQHFRKIRR
jgi:hypothetical protein